MLGDQVISYIRTVVPLAVGSLIILIGKHLGVYTPDTTGWAATATAVVSAAYYVVIRWAEAKWPNLGWLLGSPTAPTYTKP